MKKEQSMQEWFANMSEKERNEFFKRVLGPKRQAIIGHEKQQLLTMFALMKPVKETNNQRFLTEYYDVGGVEYVVTYGLNDEPMVERTVEDAY